MGMSIAGVVLAAGSATRMGRNKLLLRIGGEPLVRRVARAAVEADLAPVLVVVGPDADLVREALAGLPCQPVANPRHALGMSASLDAGFAAVPGHVDAGVVLLADMPFVDAAAIRAVVAPHARGARITTARYGGVPAPPTLYDRALFAELRGGVGEGRGREMVRRHAAEVVFVDFPASALSDVDEAGDLERARARLGEEAP
jgi:molybdenum cofactor cytidylyltransferase